jgi:hypothetical protein
LANQPVVGATGSLGLDGFHNLAHLGLRGRTEFSDRGFYDLFDLRWGKLFGGTI